MAKSRPKQNMPGPGHYNPIYKLRERFGGTIKLVREFNEDDSKEYVNKFKYNDINRLNNK